MISECLRINDLWLLNQKACGKKRYLHKLRYCPRISRQLKSDTKLQLPFPVFWSRCEPGTSRTPGSSVSIVTRLRTGRPRNGDSIPDKDKRFFSSPKLQSGPGAHTSYSVPLNALKCVHAPRPALKSWYSFFKYCSVRMRGMGGFGVGGGALWYDIFVNCNWVVTRWQ
jgi:hypothetical protein